MARADTQIDRLYQLPLDEFTSARNALAKETGDADIRGLTKPPVAAWAVNQLYWRQREVYDALIEAAKSVRASHKAVLGGRKGDLRSAGREHDDAVENALKATLALLTESGHPVTDATRQAILNTLRALPADDPPGRLSRVLQPGGFEMLAGISVAPGRQVAAPAREKKTAGRKDRAAGATGARDDKAREAAEREKEAAAHALRELREAEQAARREEFESARATREAERASRRLESARERLETIRREVEEAESAAAAAERERDAAERAAKDATRRLEAARKKAGLD